MRTSLWILVAGAFATAGCGAAPASSADRFDGERRAVAEAVEEIQTAAERGDAERMCRDLLSRELRDRIGSAGSSCDKEMEKAIKDVNAFELVVREVTVTGTTAQAAVRGEAGDADVSRTLRLLKEDGRWRVTSFGSSTR